MVILALANPTKDLQLFPQFDPVMQAKTGFFLFVKEKHCGSTASLLGPMSSVEFKFVGNAECQI